MTTGNPGPGGAVSEILFREDEIAYPIPSLAGGLAAGVGVTLLFALGAAFSAALVFVTQ